MKKYLFYFIVAILSLISCHNDEEAQLNFESNFSGNWNLKVTQSLMNSDTLIKSYVDEYSCKIYNDHTFLAHKLHYKFDTLYWQFRPNENRIFIIADYYGPELQLYRDMEIKNNKLDFIELEEGVRYFSLFNRILIDAKMNWKFTRVK